MFIYTKPVKTKSNENLPLLTSIDGEEETNFMGTNNSRKSHSDLGIKRNEWEIFIKDRPYNIFDDDDDCNSEFNSIITQSGGHEFTELSNSQGIIHIIKASIGTGVLTLPAALKYSGWLVGTLAIFFLSLAAIYSMRLLLEIAAHLRLITPKYITNLDYEKTVRLCFENASDNLRKFRWMKDVLYVSLCLAEIGFLSSYHLFVSENTKAFVDYYVTNKQYVYSLWIYQVGFFFLFAPLIFIKTLEKMSYFCQLANLFAVVSLVISLVYCFQDPIPIEKLPIVNLSDTTFLAFGMVMFAFESINLINPIESCLKKKTEILSLFGVLNISTTFVLIFYVIIGFAGYWKFGDTISSSIILSLPMTPWYYMIVKPLYVLSIFISYSLQGYVMFNIVWKKIKVKMNNDGRMKKVAQVIWRLTIPALTTLLSVTIPHLDLFISLIGALTGSVITILIPTICHSALVYSNKQLFRWKLRLLINFILFILGITGAAIGTYSSVINIIRAMR